jgi:pyridoxal phosphate enzyme (YggS family)
MKADNLRNLQADIAKACRQAGREKSEVKLIAVSKTKPWEDVTEFLKLGLTEFGENYVQEAIEKVEAVAKWSAANSLNANWHFIGNLQSNKAKFIPGRFAMFHALDSLSLARKLDKASAELKTVLPCLVQLNVDDEESKGGITADSLPAFLESLAGFTNLKIRGLMCLPAATKASRAPFAKLRGLLETANKSSAYPQKLTELSMGMSGDLEEAILEGATYIRVGTRLFGERKR